MGKNDSAPPPAYSPPDDKSWFSRSRGNSAGAAAATTPITALPDNRLLLGWDFRIIDTHAGLQVFNSPDSYEKYKVHCKSVKGSSQFDSSQALQSNGFCMPLLQIDNLSVKLDKVIVIYKTILPHPSEKRLFNSANDKYEFCVIIPGEKLCEFRFTPNPNEPNHNFSLFMKEHPELDVYDFTYYNGSRFRWHCDCESGGYSRWKYSLHVLGPNQPSLVDNMDQMGNIWPGNPLVGPNWKKNISRGESIVGELLEIFTGWSTQFIHKEMRLGPVDPESINSVSMDTLVFLCMVCYFKRLEDAKKRRRKRRNNLIK